LVGLLFLLILASNIKPKELAVTVCCDELVQQIVQHLLVDQVCSFSRQDSNAIKDFSSVVALPVSGSLPALFQLDASLDLLRLS
jgi:hypothetical protein